MVDTMKDCMGNTFGIHDVLVSKDYPPGPGIECVAFELSPLGDWVAVFDNGQKNIRLTQSALSDVSHWVLDSKADQRPQ